MIMIIRMNASTHSAYVCSDTVVAADDKLKPQVTFNSVVFSTDLFASGQFNVIINL